MPAAQQLVPVNSSASNIEFFPYEAAQLTPEVITTLSSYNLSSFNVTNADIFALGDASAATANRKRSEAVCKYLPGDREWPSSLTWALFDLFLGSGALIKSVPAAAVCYADWPQYDSAQCDAVTANWTDAVWG